MKVLLSIKPEFADRIFSGKKMFEYRKAIFKNPVSTIVVYSSSPVKRVIGEFAVKTIHHGSVDELWSQTKEYSGITRDLYDEYFANRLKGYAIEISTPILYPESKDLKKEFGIIPPQSFAYVE